MELSYYPGCSLHGTAKEYDESTQAVCRALDIDLRELENWSCCGATSGHAIGGELALALPARNLALASGQGRDLVVPCAACFHRLRTALVAARDGKLPPSADPVPHPVEVRSLVGLLADPAVLQGMRGKVVRPLTALRAVPYYGCLLVRPAEVTGAENCEDPQELDLILGALGVTLKKWSFKTVCCGAGLTLSRTDVVDRLVTRILDQARRAGADCIVTACPMCFSNLESRQFERLNAGLIGQVDLVPVFFFTELIGLALALDAFPTWMRRHVLDPQPLLESRGLP